MQNRIKLILINLISLVFIFGSAVIAFSNVPYAEIQKKLCEYGYLTEEFVNNVETSEFINAYNNYCLKNNCIYVSFTSPNVLEIFNKNNIVENIIDYTSEKSLIYKYQKILMDANFFAGPLDGEYSVRFEEAVKKYQYSNKQVVDGYITPATRICLEHLNKPWDKQSMVHLARVKFNSDYVYATMGPDTFDCSGFVYWVLCCMGFKGDRLGTMQWRMDERFKRIDKFEDLQFGDLILWESHMGIVTENGMVIDASQSCNGVSERNLSNLKSLEFICGYRIFE